MKKRYSIIQRRIGENKETTRARTGTVGYFV